MFGSPRFTGFISIAVALAVWELVIFFGVFDSRLLAPPSKVGMALLEMAQSGTLIRDVVVSGTRIGIGFAIGAFAGVALGVATGTSSAVRNTLGPLIQLLRPVTPVALAPLAIVFFGLSELAKYFLVAWGVFFAVWMSTHVGVIGVNRRLVWAASSLGASPARLRFGVYPLAALPVIVSGLRTAIGIAFICVVVAEMTGAGASEGLGYRVKIAYEIFRVDRMIAILSVLGALGAAADHLFAATARKMLPWLEMRWV